MATTPETTTSLAAKSPQTSTSNDDGLTDTTFRGLANLIKLLPTGTVFIYQFLNPVLTNNGQCQAVNKYLSSILFVLCGFSCFLSSFTDSYQGSDGRTHYGFATPSGFYPAIAAESVDLKSYRLQLADFVHASLSLVVFTVLALLDGNTVRCFYPSFESSQKALIMAVPPVLGTVAGVVFMIFPTTRHGIGYRPIKDSNKP
ncbi:hypothetical protein NMG60_11029824 [Bertholletia excelsa]